MLSRDHLIQLVVLAVLAANLAAFAWMSEQRYFDYDEFQVLYASNSMLHGKALYADQVGTHFPLTNFLIATVIEATGATASSVVVARRLVLVFSVFTLFMVYKTGTALGNREVGLVAAALTATCSVFFDKAMEIRHDVFSTGFLVGAIYLFVRFHASRKLLWLCLSGVCAGLALAATQKAIVSLTGIGLGIAVVSWSSQGRKEAINAVFLREKAKSENCYKGVIRKHGKRRGKFIIKVSLKEDGSMSAFKVVVDEVGKGMAPCVEAKLERIPFPAISAPTMIAKLWIFG